MQDNLFGGYYLYFQEYRPVMENPIGRLPQMIIIIELHAVFCKITELWGFIKIKEMTDWGFVLMYIGS